MQVDCIEKNGYWNTRVLQNRRLYFNWLQCFINLTWNISFFWILRPYPNIKSSPNWMEPPNFYGSRKHNTSAKMNSPPKNFMTEPVFGPNSVKLSVYPLGILPTKESIEISGSLPFTEKKPRS